MRFVDLFAGIGGFRIGLEAAGHGCVWACEIDKFAVKTYEANTGDLPADDITQIKADDIPDHDLLTAGFPCQDFSKSGRKEGAGGKNGQLYLEIARVLKAKQPKWFLLENVPHLVYAQNKDYFRAVLLSLRACGYEVDTRLIWSYDHGLAQARQRVYFVGRRVKNLFWHFDWPKTTNPGPPLEAILEHNVDQKHYLTIGQLKSALKLKPRKFNRQGNSWPLSRRGYCKTITSGIRSTSAESVIILCPDKTDLDGPIWDAHGKNLYDLEIEDLLGLARFITPREAARLQGFSDDFKLPCSDTQTYKQLANAVSVPVITAIAEGFNA